MWKLGEGSREAGAEGIGLCAQLRRLGGGWMGMADCFEAIGEEDEFLFEEKS